MKLLIGHVIGKILQIQMKIIPLIIGVVTTSVTHPKILVTMIGIIVNIMMTLQPTTVLTGLVVKAQTKMGNGAIQRHLLTGATVATQGTLKMMILMKMTSLCLQ